MKPLNVEHLTTTATTKIQKYNIDCQELYLEMVININKWPPKFISTLEIGLLNLIKRYIFI